MKIDKIITLGNERVKIPLLAMIRSLRAVGCELPVWVIPYDENTFDLPDGCQWWRNDELYDWLKQQGGRPVMRKYQTLLADNYQFVDSDVIFIRDPAPVLAPYEGWVASCCHWSNPEHTYTEHSLPILRARTTTWPSKIFNTGQFACDRALYDLESFKATAANPDYRRTIIDDPFHEQPGINLLVHLSGAPISNLTLPPINMESTWAGDYIDADYERYWQDEARKPYIIHWAGEKMNPDKPISGLFFQYLSEDEKSKFLADSAESAPSNAKRLKRKIGAAWDALKDT